MLLDIPPVKSILCTITLLAVVESDWVSRSWYSEAMSCREDLLVEGVLLEADEVGTSGDDVSSMESPCS